MKPSWYDGTLENFLIFFVVSYFSVTRLMTKRAKNAIKDQGRIFTIVNPYVKIEKNRRCEVAALMMRPAKILKRRATAAAVMQHQHPEPEPEEPENPEVGPPIFDINPHFRCKAHIYDVFLANFAHSSKM